MIGGGYVDRAIGRAGRQLGSEAAEAVRRVSEIVANVVVGAADPEGDGLVGEEAVSGDDIAAGFDRRRAGSLRCRVVAW